jgi:hypothetical protein
LRLVRKITMTPVLLIVDQMGSKKAFLGSTWMKLTVTDTATIATHQRRQAAEHCSPKNGKAARRYQDWKR